MSAYVDEVPYRATGVYAPIEDIQDTINYTRSYADEQRAALNTAIINLEALVGSYTPSFDAVTADIPAVVQPSYPDAPDLTMDINENWPTNDIPEPVIRDIYPDFSFVEPTVPESLDPSFDYTPGAYDSCVWDLLCAKVRDTLINGGTGLSDSVYGLIIGRHREARRNAEERARRRAYNAVGARGFDLPGGMASAVILEMEQDILTKDLDAVNTTTIKDFDLADANTKFGQDMAARMEEINVNKYNTTEDRLFKIAQVSQELLIAIYEQNVKIYIAQWEGVKIQLEAIKIEVDTIIAYNENQIQIYLGMIEAYKTEIEAIASENKSKTDLAQAEANIYETEVKAMTAIFTAQIEEIKVALEQYRLELSEVLEKERINLDAYTSAAALAERVAESIANIASQSIASALGALNTSESIGYSGSESLSYGSSLSNSLSEGHNYEDE